jgi:integrase
MSVRKRTWKTAAGEERQAWLCDYIGQSGKRHVKTFAHKKDADAFIAKAKVEVREGVHTADSDSVTIRDAADLWLTTGAARGRASSMTQTRIGATPDIGQILDTCRSYELTY